MLATTPTFLDHEQTLTLKTLLEERARSLAAVIDAHLHIEGTLGVPAAVMDTDESTRAAETEFALSEIERETEEQVAVAQALERIEAGSYGVCMSCGEPIGFERLLAHPTATRCLSCQSRIEKTRG
ncbi:MAG: TraR/DksA family transcriptional regulator [Casimicrobiaceae bacterium]